MVHNPALKLGLRRAEVEHKTPQQLAQAQFDVEKARGSERDAFVDLMEAVGLSPAVQIRITEDFCSSGSSTSAPIHA